MIADQLSQGVKFLHENGYNLFSITATGSLPEDTMEFFNAREIDLKKYPTIVTIGSGGKRLWEAMQSSPMDPEHPVNHFTATIVNEFIKTYLNTDDIVTAFPSQPPRPFDSPSTRPIHGLAQDRSGLRPTGEKKNLAHFPIQTFAHWLGWAHPTPLGKNIHKEFGLWHAYRSAFLTTLELPETPREMFPSPCDTCEDKPCIKVCPSQAVGAVKQTLADFDKVKCFTFRLKENSICADRCISRIACPIAREHKYTMPQMNHHYSRSRRSIIEKHNTNNQYGYVTAQ